MGFTFSFGAFRRAAGYPGWNGAFRFDTSAVERGPRISDVPIIGLDR